MTCSVGVRAGYTVSKIAEALSGLSSPGTKNEETYDEKVGNERILCHNLKQELEIALQELS
jgi:hypothetical protein